MSLKCAIQLVILDLIHNPGQPITLPELVSKLHIDPQKTSGMDRIIRLLVHSGFFTKTKVLENQEAYTLTPSFRLLLKDRITSMLPFALATLDPVMQSPLHSLGDWFRGSELTPFEKVHGLALWEYCRQNREMMNNIFK